MGDPTANGYYKPTPTTIPILDRIDIIEEQTVWPQVTKVGPEDLTPSDLEYRIHPGDALEVEIYGLYSQGQHYPVQRVVDQGGYFRVPEVGDVLVAGLTQQDAQDKIEKALSGTVLSHPSVQVNLLNQTGFRYTVYGGLARWGVFSLSNPNLRLVDVLALAGGVPQATKKIHVIRQLAVSDTMLSSWDRENNQSTESPSSKPKTDYPTNPTSPTTPSIEDLINQLDTGGANENAQESVSTPEPTEKPDQDIQDLIQQLDIGDTTESGDSSPIVSPGVLQTSDYAVIDVDDLVPPNNNTHQPIDVDDLDGKPSRGGTSDAAYIYVPENDSWISVSTDPLKRTNGKEKSSDK